MKENPIRSLPGIPYLLGVLLLAVIAVWVFAVGIGPDPDNGITSGWLVAAGLLVSKKRQPPQLFDLPLRPRDDGLQVARPLGTLAGVPQADAEEVRANPRLARIRSQVTAADIAPDRHAMAVLTYRDVLVYPRRDRESWTQALARPPQVHSLPWLPQAEALGWSADSRALYATGELSPAPLLYLNPRSDRAR
jgi:hypothetical protein